MTHIQKAKVEKITPLEHGREESLDYSKVIPLEVAHIDAHENASDKLDEVYLRLLRLKRLGRIRHARCKAWVYEYGLALDV